MLGKINISLAGCGFMGIYHIGVASCLKEYAPHLLLNKISGASFGALAGCCLLSDVSLGIFTSEMLKMVHEIRSRALGPFNPLINIQKMLSNVLINHIPKNAYKVVSGRIFISMTRISDGKNFIVSEFKSNEDLMDALLASTFVPFFSGFVPPKFRDERYIDGGFSNNLPVLDEHTITVSPFCGESDICPRDSTLQLFHVSKVNVCNTSIVLSKPNFYRLARILFPPSPDILVDMCKRGFDDALKFLKRNNMISCSKCLTLQRVISFPMTKNSDDSDISYDPECEECAIHIKKATDSNLPEPVLSNFKAAIDMTNKELKSWSNRARRFKIISALTLPYFLTVDTIQAILNKFAEVTPYILENISVWSEYLLKVIIKMLERMNRTGLLLASKVLGQLSISVTLYNDKEKFDQNICTDEVPRKNKISIQFDFDPEAPKMSNFSPAELENNDMQEHGTMIIQPIEDMEITDDNYDHLVKIIEHHDTMMLFHYLDDKEKMNVIEFIGVPIDDEVINKIDETNVKVIASIVERSDRTSSEDLNDCYSSRSVGDDTESNGNFSDDNGQFISSDPESEWSLSNKEPKNPKRKSVEKIRSSSAKK